MEVHLSDKRDELEALRYKAGGASAIRYDKEQVQTSPQDYLTMAVIDAIELERQIEEDEASIEDMKGRVYSIVRQMETEEHRTFIIWYYLNGLSMIETAGRMNMSERNTYYVQEKSLEEFGVFLQKN